MRLNEKEFLTEIDSASKFLGMYQFRIDLYHLSLRAFIVRFPIWKKTLFFILLFHGLKTIPCNESIKRVNLYFNSIPLQFSLVH